MPWITVDGKRIEAKPGQMVLQACNDADMAIPQYCYHPGLSIPASCRICLVEVEGIPKLVPSCQTPIRDGMVVHSKSTKAVANQKQVMEYLLINHPLDCPVCDQAGECFLQDYSYGFGRSQSRFEEDKAKKPKKDVGKNILLYNDRCIMCTRCVRFTREISGESELYVDGRGHREEIDIFPGKPLDNKLSGNVADLCPVGALLDKDFLFKQRVWLLKSTPSVSPVDAGGENIYLQYNEGVIYRVKPHYNADVNGWWISDDTRYSYKAVHDDKRIVKAMKTQYGTQVPTTFTTALETAESSLKEIAKLNEPGSLYVVLSPMMATEEAWLLGTWIRSLDPQALIAIGPVPTSGKNETFKNYMSGKQTFEIQAEKVPNAKGIHRVMELLGGPRANFDELTAGTGPEIGKLKGGWIVGGYLSNWLTATQPAVFKKGFRVVQDILPNSLTTACDVLLPAAAWAEKDGSWENFAGKIQPFQAAIAPPEGVRREGDVYFKLLGRTGAYNAEDVRKEMGGELADAKIVVEAVSKKPAMEFAELSRMMHRVLSILGVMFCVGALVNNAACSAATPGPSSAPTTAPSQFVSKSYGFSVSWPADWTKIKKSGEDVLALVPTSQANAKNMDVVPEIDIQVPALPMHIPGMIPIGSVVSGYVDDLNKHYTNVHVDERVSVTIPNASARRVVTTMLDKGKPWRDVAVLIVHADKVYVIDADCSADDYTPTRAAFDSLVASLNWIR